MKKIVVVACGVMALSLSAAVVTLDGETEYAVASGVTNTVSDTLTGSGSIQKTGAGLLVLSGEGNDFTGGITVNAGTVQAASANAFGSGTVTLPSATSTVQFNVTPATAGDFTTFTNPFAFTGTANVSANGSAYSMLFYTNTRFTQDVTGTRSFRLRHNPKNTGNPKNGGPSTIFDGALSAPGNLFLNLYGNMTMNGVLTVASLYGGEVWSGGGKLILNNPANAIGTMYVNLNTVICGATNVMRDAKIRWKSAGGGVSAGYWVSLIDLNGFDQTVSSIAFVLQNNVGWDNNRYDSGEFFCITSAVPATLTITGESSNQTAYETLRANVSLVLDAQDYPSFRQTFAYNSSPFKGTTHVKAGTLALAENGRFTGTPSLTIEAGATFLNVSTNALPALPSVTNLVVNGTFDATAARVYPFAAVLENLEIGENASLALSAGSKISVKRVTVGGETFTSGVLTETDVPQLNGAVILVGDPAALTDAHWTGASSLNLSAAGNWEEADVNLTSGSTFAWFANSGNTAKLDMTAYLHGIGFRAAENESGFMLGRSSESGCGVYLADGGNIMACTNEPSGTVAHTYVIDTPLALNGDVSVHVDTNQTLIVSNAFHDTATAMGQSSFTIDGTDMNADKRYGRVVFAGTNWYGGALVSTASLWKVTGLLANPDNAYTGDPEANGNEDRAISLLIDQSNIKQNNLGSATYGIQLDNATIGKSILIRGPISIRALSTISRSTNEITGFVRYASTAANWHKVELASNSELVLSGGLRSSHSFRTFGTGTLRMRNIPVRCSDSAGFNPQDGRSVFEVAGNYFNYLCIGYSASGNPVVEMTVDYAMTNGQVQVGGNGSSVSSCVGMSSGTYTLDLHATTQRCQRLAVLKRGILKGDYPAMLEVYEGRRSTDKEGYVVLGQVNGGVGLHQCGGGTLTFTNQTFASCGDLEVSKGTMEFTDDATWLNGTNVTVRGMGTLKLAAGGRFSGTQAVLHLGADADTWQIDIPAGQAQAFAYAYDAEGRLLPSGTYGNAASGAAHQRFAAHFPNNGRVYVRRHGTSLMIR